MDRTTLGKTGLLIIRLGKMQKNDPLARRDSINRPSISHEKKALISRTPWPPYPDLSVRKLTFRKSKAPGAAVMLLLPAHPPRKRTKTPPSSHAPPPPLSVPEIHAPLTAASNNTIPHKERPQHILQSLPSTSINR